MREPKVRLVRSSKPLDKFTAEDRRVFDAPDVEDHLEAIRAALALAIAVNLGGQHEYAEGIEGLIAEAANAARLQAEAAWQRVRELQAGFGGDIHTLHVIVDDSGEPEGAR